MGVTCEAGRRSLPPGGERTCHCRAIAIPNRSSGRDHVVEILRCLDDVDLHAVDRARRSAAGVGAQSAVLWKRLNFSPLAARRSAVGVAMTPPKAEDAAKPTSSRRATRTFRAPDGGRSGSIGGNVAAGSFASAIVDGSGVGSGMGSVDR
jgi:hypothetical protein